MYLGPQVSSLPSHLSSPTEEYVYLLYLEMIDRLEASLLLFGMRWDLRPFCGLRCRGLGVGRVWKTQFVHFGFRWIANVQGVFVVTNSRRLPDLALEGLGVPDHVFLDRLRSLTLDRSLLLMMISHLNRFVVSLMESLVHSSQGFVRSDQSLVCSHQALVCSDESCHSILLVSVETKATIPLTELPPADAPAVEVNASPCADLFTGPALLLGLSSRSSRLTSNIE